MMRKFLVYATCACFFAACSPNPRKEPFNKILNGQERGKAMPKDEQLAKIIENSTECLQLEDVIQRLNSMSKRVFTVYVSNLDLSEDDVNSWSGDDQTRARVLLVDARKPLVETPYNAEFKNSNLVGSLVTLKQNACQTIDSGGKRFNIQASKSTQRASMPPQLPLGRTNPNTRTQQFPQQFSSTPRGKTLIEMRSEGESRTYSIRGDELHIIVSKPVAKEVESCKGEKVSNLKRKEHYVINFSGNDVTPKLEASYITLLKTLFEFPSDVDLATTPKDVPPKAQSRNDGPKPRVGAQLSVGALERFNRQLAEGTNKPLTCNGKPSTEQPDKPSKTTHPEIPPTYQGSS